VVESRLEQVRDIRAMADLSEVRETSIVRVERFPGLPDERDKAVFV
jgi:hypothetical protein